MQKGQFPAEVWYTDCDDLPVPMTNNPPKEAVRYIRADLAEWPIVKKYAEEQSRLWDLLETEGYSRKRGDVSLESCLAHLIERKRLILFNLPREF